MARAKDYALMTFVVVLGLFLFCTFTQNWHSLAFSSSDNKVKVYQPDKTPNLKEETNMIKECAIIKTGEEKHFDPDCALRTLKSLKQDTKDLWEGHDPVEVYKRWPGLLLHGDYMLREFVDPDDPHALGMGNKPQSIENVEDGGAEERFHQLVSLNHLLCADIRRMGKIADGGWDVCVSGPYKPRKGCIVYSFGINYDFSFDDAMGKNYQCQVMSYDPSMKKKESHKRSEYVYFNKIGLGNADLVNGRGWKIMTLDSMLKENGHTDKIIDYLKIDIEFNEWASLKVILEKKTLQKVKQFGLEIHTVELRKKHSSTKFDLYEFYNILFGLEKQGFRRYKLHSNPSGRFKSKWIGKTRNCCYEIYYVNVNFLNDS